MLGLVLGYKLRVHELILPRCALPILRDPGPREPSRCCAPRRAAMPP